MIGTPPDEGENDSTRAMTVLLAGAAFLVLAATSIRNNRPSPLLLAVAVCAWVWTLAGCLIRWPDRWCGPARRILRRLPWMMVVPVLSLYAYRSSLEIRWQGFSRGPLWAQLALLGLVLASYATGRGFRPAWRFPLVALAMLGMGFWVVRDWSPPVVDVYRLQQDAARQLTRGTNPYAAEHPDIPWNPDFDGLPVRADGHLRSFPYPPLSLLLVLPGAWLGDVRWVLLVGWVGTAALAVAVGRRSGLPAGHPAELVGIALLHYPMALRILYNAWTEPLQGLALGGCVWCMLAGRGRPAGVCLGAVVGLKQFGFVGIPPLLATRRSSVRGFVAGLSVAALATLPFALWDFPAFLLGNVTYHTSSPIRHDSHSLTAALARLGSPIPTAVGFLVTFAVMIGTARRAGTSIARATLGSAACFWTFFLFGKAAHVNYLWLVAAMLTLAMLAGLGRLWDGPGRFEIGSESSLQSKRIEQSISQVRALPEIQVEPAMSVIDHADS